MERIFPGPAHDRPAKGPHAPAWQLSYGDGAPTSPAHSFYHKYAGAGNYLASLQATGPAGTDAASKTVPVKAPANPGLALLLLEG